jgi:folate-dependent phosphoribosylglycinamide formyltransferase PurN
MKKSIAIFASGSGSNAENIYHEQYLLSGLGYLNVATLVCNNPNAGVIEAI